jgi:hypothetical protein
VLAHVLCALPPKRANESRVIAQFVCCTDDLLLKFCAQVIQTTLKSENTGG